MKLLLYCTKSKPYLYGQYIGQLGCRFAWLAKNKNILKSDYKILNGKIVAKCDCEKIKLICPDFNYLDASCNGAEGFILYKSCLFRKDLIDYGQGKFLYALYLSNLEAFYNPKELRYYGVKTAPQNMMKVFDDKGNEYVLISIRPEHLANILNGKKTIEVRKRILKSMEGLMK